MDREEMRFRLFMRLMEGSTCDESRQWAIEASTRLLELFDKSRPDYQDPAKIEETIQARVDEAVKKDREATRAALKTLLHKGIPLGMRDVEVMQAWDRPGSTLRFSSEAAEAYAREVIP